MPVKQMDYLTCSLRCFCDRRPDVFLNIYRSSHNVLCAVFLKTRPRCCLFVLQLFKKINKYLNRANLCHYIRSHLKSCSAHTHTLTNSHRKHSLCNEQTGWRRGGDCPLGGAPSLFHGEAAAPLRRCKTASWSLCARVKWNARSDGGLALSDTTSGG